MQQQAVNGVTTEFSGIIIMDYRDRSVVEGVNIRCDTLVSFKCESVFFVSLVFDAQCLGSYSYVSLLLAHSVRLG